MSSDYSIPTKDLLANNCSISVDICEYTGLIEHTIQFPNYPHLRNCALATELTSNDKVLISCSGNFRIYLDRWLKVNKVKHAKY